jgi:hypothetical protein
MMDPVIWHWFLGPVVPSSSPLWQSHLACGPARGIDVHYSSHETSRDQVVVCIACAQTNPMTPYSGFGTFGKLCRQYATLGGFGAFITLLQLIFMFGACSDPQ